MLRITITETATEQRWTLEGRLVGPWVGQLRTNWENRHRAQNGRACTVDLNGVTSIDKGGRRLLRAMSKEGTQLIATGVHIKYVLDQLQPARRGPLKAISGLFAPLRAAASVLLFWMQAVLQRTKTNAGKCLKAELNSTDQRPGIKVVPFPRRRKKEHPGAS
jgi:ABC-type transporter Mla MlaB component